MELIKSFLSAIICGAVGRQATREFTAWTPWIIERLIRRAVTKLPESQRERFEEEWRGHIDEIPGDIGKLVAAVGFGSAARQMSSLLNSNRNSSSARQVFGRAFDMSFSAFALYLLFPVIFIVGLLIRVGSPGPVFFRSARLGLHGRPFSVWKFRTLECSATSTTPSRRDRSEFQEALPRITRIGRFLRRFSMDELPIFINVLRGEMSCIGPVPHTPLLATRLSQVIPNYRERAKVRPGLTGWAQVHECTTWNEAVEYDLYYVNNRSLKLDFIILWRTMARVWSAG